MEPQPHILVVDDDREIRDLLSKFLERQGMRVSAARDAKEARKLWPLGRYHLVVLDLMLPGESGLDLAKWLRSQAEIPIVMLTAMSEETDRIVGLELGADDYLGKPFNPRELLARIRAVLRRANGEPGTAKEPPAKAIRFSGWTLEPARRRLLNPDGAEVPLTGGEYKLLQVLVERPNRVLTRDMLMDLLRGRQAGPFDRAIDVAVSRLRRKLEDDGRNPSLIKTVRGGGYVLAATVEKVNQLSRSAQEAPPRRRWVFWPRSLAGRTALVLLLALTVVQAAGLTIHALDRMDLQRFAQAREISQRAISAWRTVLLAPPDRRAQMLAEMELPSALSATLDDLPLARPELPPMPPPVVRALRLDMLANSPPRFRPREVITAWMPGGPTFAASLRLPSGEWLNLHINLLPPRPWHSETFLIAFAAMTLAAGLLILWAVRRLTRPVRALAEAAERLGRDVNAPPLPEAGPTEVATAAHAFNTMAARIRRFVGDRTQMLAAIGHDLRTPITRLRLRAEFMDDDEQRRKMLADLDEMEAMVAATLAFARDESAAEPTVAVDIAALCRTVLDEAADGHPDLAEAIAYQGPDRLVAQVRPVAMKRAIANLVGNALAYGSAARLSLSAPEPPARPLRLAIEDDGPGIPLAELEAVFQPFRRLEVSRNRETGGTGLGLPIARNIFRAHGGDVVLRNRSGGGLVALATLPG